MGVLRILVALTLAQPLAASAQQLRIALVKREVVEARLNRVSPKPGARLAALEALFAEAGCPPEQMRQQQVPQNALPNVICSLPGSSEDTVVVGAHYDFATDFGRGVIDNWTGAALLPSIYEALRVAGPHRLSYIFVGFTGEERGLLGSRYFVKTLSPEMKKTIRAMVNLDCLGLTSSKIEFRPKFEQLATWLASVASRLKVPLAAVDVSRIGSSDHESFASAGIPAICIHSIVPENYRTLHSIADRVDAVQLAEYYDTYKLAAVYVAILDTVLPKFE